MGLDIVSFGMVTLVSPVDKQDDEKWDKLEENTTILIKSDFRSASDDMQEGVYRFEEQMSFRAGSYSGYNQWRELLCEFAFGFEPEIIWKDYGKYKRRPFARLIHFSDCEGIIGTRECKKLADDFVEWEPMVERYFNNIDKSFVEKYKLWKDAFLLAANNGFVSFG